MNQKKKELIVEAQEKHGAVSCRISTRKKYDYRVPVSFHFFNSEDLEVCSFSEIDFENSDLRVFKESRNWSNTFKNDVDIVFIDDILNDSRMLATRLPIIYSKN